MGYASIAGRARTNPSKPSAHAICDRCGFRYCLTDLKFQFDWRGTSMQNLRILVCERCYDKPQEQLRTIIYPPDPPPVPNARPQDFVDAESDYRITEGTTIDPLTGIPMPSGNTRITEDGQVRITQPVGPPDGFDAGAQMPLVAQQKWAVKLPILSVSGDVPSQVVSVTCDGPHGLSTGAQVIAQGLDDAGACGCFAVTVTTATAFNYTTQNPMRTQGNLLTAEGFIITSNVGMPYGVSQVP